MLGLVQVYPFGAEWIIISDGVPYSTIFDIPPNLVRAYQERLREYRNRLNLQATVHIINMADMTSRFKGFEDTYQSIRNQLENLLRYGKLEKKFAILTRGMAWNMNTKPFLEQHDWCDLWEVLNSEQPPQESRLAELYKEVNRQARQIAIKYASFNLSMKYLGLMNKFFPFAIRATVHPKQGQVAIPQLGEIYPWNGTVLLRRNVKTVGSIESMPLYKILRKADLSPKFLPGSNAPFYYE
jgi:pyoverdine/dityrosine biosynthesis protein Dit1